MQVVRVPGFQAIAVRTEIVPPSRVRNNVRASAVTLKAGPASATLRTLAVRRQSSLQQIRVNPRLAVGRAMVDMAPVLANPKALFNIAQSIRRQPAVAEVMADDTRLYEVPQGLIIQSFLTYRIRPGTCTDPTRRGMLSRTGIVCAVRMTDATRAAAFANPGDPHYVSNPRLRAAVIADARSKAAEDEAGFTSDIAQLRAALNDPAQRAAIDSQRGAGEAARLSAMSDDALKEEVINSGETAVEQTAFVPVADDSDATNPNGPRAAPPQQLKPVVDVETPLNTVIYVTGFTLGKEYEWRQRIEKSINRCLVGCSKTYYAEASAGFHYGFGLRFPIQLGGLYSYHEDKAAKTAKVRIDFTPINGSTQNYRDAGMPEGKLFDGKELVAQVGAHAGFSADLPLIPDINISADPKLDFTEMLPGEFFLGQITPPAPGAANPPKFEKYFTDIDLLGGQASFGIVGAKVFPAVKLELTSQGLQFNVRDLATNTTTSVTKSGQVVDLTIAGKDNVSRFTIGDPLYKLGFDITPGIAARLYIDIAVWSQNWDFPMWFPQLTMHLPPGDATFGCHAETICSRTYTYAPKFNSQTDGAQGALAAELENWGAGFDQRWMSECPDDTCRTGLNFVRQGTIWGAQHKQDADASVTFASLAPLLAQADKDAQVIVNEGQARQTTSAAKSFATLIQAIWSPRCSDTKCYKDIKGVLFFYQLEMIAYQKQHPDMGTHDVLVTVMPKFTPALQDVIDKSKARVAAEAAWQAQHAARPNGPVKKLITPVRLPSGSQ